MLLGPEKEPQAGGWQVFAVSILWGKEGSARGCRWGTRVAAPSHWLRGRTGWWPRYLPSIMLSDFRVQFHCKTFSCSPIRGWERQALGSVGLCLKPHTQLNMADSWFKPGLFDLADPIFSPSVHFSGSLCISDSWSSAFRPISVICTKALMSAEVNKMLILINRLNWEMLKPEICLQ